ncbi:BTB/POZ domain-containing protein [Tanacetum coccineum]
MEVELGCPEINATCVDYLEASSWEDAKEEEQIEYMLAEDDDALLLMADDNIKLKILTKLELLKDVFENWIGTSKNIVKVVDRVSQQAEMMETKLKNYEGGFDGMNNGIGKWVIFV